MAYIFDYGVKPKSVRFFHLLNWISIFCILKKAKLQASLRWLIGKAYPNSTPKHLNEPYFEENEVSSLWINYDQPKRTRFDTFLSFLKARQIVARRCRARTHKRQNLLASVQEHLSTKAVQVRTCARCARTFEQKLDSSERRERWPSDATGHRTRLSILRGMLPLSLSFFYC